MFSKLDVSDRQNWLEDRMIQDSVVILIKGVLNKSLKKWTVKSGKWVAKQKWVVFRWSDFILIEIGRRKVWIPNWIWTYIWNEVGTFNFYCRWPSIFTL